MYSWMCTYTHLWQKGVAEGQKLMSDMTTIFIEYFTIISYMMTVISRENIHIPHMHHHHVASPHGRLAKMNIQFAQVFIRVLYIITKL